MANRRDMMSGGAGHLLEGRAWFAVPRWRARLGAVVLGAGLAVVAVPVIGPTGVSAAPAQNCAQPGSAIAAVPWAQQLLVPGRVWPLATGKQVTVALVDTGVDASHSQLTGRVISGRDLLDPSANATTDCIGHGTQVAGVIAARAADRIAMRGLAPDATIAPARVGDDLGGGSGESATTATTVAAAIRWAVEIKAQVIDVSVVLYADDPGLRAAVQDAIAHNAVVVAAVGDGGGSEENNRTPYPAAYDGVIGVGAIDETGTRWGNSQHGPYVDLVAPGTKVVTTQRGGGLNVVEGTSIAAGFVAATAALVRSRYPTLSAAQVSQRLLSTAAPAVAGPGSEEYGSGVVDPYAATTTILSDERPADLPGLPVRVEDPVARARAHAWVDSARTSLIVAGAAITLAALVYVLARTLPSGRRRRWTPGLVPAPVDVPEGEPTPPRNLFDE